jgi:hypothetical protein
MMIEDIQIIHDAVGFIKEGPGVFGAKPFIGMNCPAPVFEWVPSLWDGLVYVDNARY